MSINPVEIPTGAVRYNTDSGKMEVYIGSTWMQVSTTEAVTTAGRGISAGGASPGSSPYARVNTIEYINISTLGDAVDFGDLSRINGGGATSASTTRGVYAGGAAPTTNTVDHLTIATAGNSVDIGDLTVARGNLAGFSNQVRAIQGGGATPSQSNVIDFLTIANLGNATDFGDVADFRREMNAAMASPTRGVYGGGYKSPTAIKTMEFINPVSKGNGVNFGDLTATVYANRGLSNTHGGL